MKVSFLLSGLLVASLLACSPAKRKAHPALNGEEAQHSVYDDSTLHQTRLPVLMPYNRIIDPAGAVISWGDPAQENHSLDAQLIPGTSLLAVEDRYGVAVIDTKKQALIARWTYSSEKKLSRLMSTYSGLQVVDINRETRLLWSAANADSHESYVLQAVWDGSRLRLKNTIPFKPEGGSPLALPNELAVHTENGTPYLYVVLNGNNRLEKLDLEKQTRIWSVPTGVAPYGLVLVGNKAYVSNWGGPVPNDILNRETAGVPYGKAYTNPKTGAIQQGSVSVFNLQQGTLLGEIKVGLHPNDLIASHNGRFIYTANGNSDDVSVIDTRSGKVVNTLAVMLYPGNKGFIGDSPDALQISADDQTLYVANGLDNAVAVVDLKGKGKLKGFIPTEAYPGGLVLSEGRLLITNLEGEGARINSEQMTRAKGSDVPDTQGGAFNSHHQAATLSIITLPDDSLLATYTQKVGQLNLTFRAQLARVLPRKNIAPVPVPLRIGEPSVFKHVLYIIKENRTYDQVLGDMPAGNGRADLCIFGNQVTPNEHQLAKDFLLMDNYYVSGKSSAEGHQWTDAAMVTDYVEKNVRAWFRSYPHVQNDALVYDKKGFIWNDAADNGKSVRIYGEACEPHFAKGTTWTQIYEGYKAGKPFSFYNTTTIARVRPLLAPGYPGYDDHYINDQVRASAFIRELHDYETRPGDQLPQLMVMALPADHTGGTRPGLPTPRAMVADNDLALGRIIEALSHSRFWKNTVVFVTEDDSQAGWDHVSAYRTAGFVISPYSRLQQTVHVNYNQTCMVRTIEQILGLPPMNSIDATALPMFGCFSQRPAPFTYTTLPNQVPLNEMNPGTAKLKGKDLFYAKASLRPEFNHIDGGNDDLMNKIIWHAAERTRPYPQKLAGKAGKDDDD